MDFIVQSPITFCLLAVTIYFSYRVMDDPYGKHKLMFEPYAIKYGKEYFRFLSHGLIHADWIHLLFNMYVLYSFGSLVEAVYGQVFGPILGPVFYLLLYLLGLIMSSLFSFLSTKIIPLIGRLVPQVRSQELYLLLYYLCPPNQWV